MMKKIFASLVLGILISGAAIAEPVSVLIKTTKGEITVTLNADKAPKTVENFLRYTDAGFYNGTIFHRVMSGFMIQGGGLTVDMKKKDAFDTVENESKNGLSNIRSSIAMARTSNPHSASAQFFINHDNNPNLDGSSNRWGYAVFGIVTKGMDVVDAIAATKTTRKNGRGDVPVEPILIESISRI